MTRSSRFAVVPTLAVLLLAFTAVSASAAPLGLPQRPVWFGIGGSFGSSIDGLPSGEAIGIGAAYGNLTVGLRLIPVVPEITLREGVRGLDAETNNAGATAVGGIAGGVRVLLPPLPFVQGNFRVAFSHQHEAPLAVAMESVPSFFAVSFGVHDKITHRSGVETGAGLELMLDPKGVLGMFAQGTVLIFPGSEGPPVTLLGEVGLSIAIGKPLF